MRDGRCVKCAGTDVRRIANDHTTVAIAVTPRRRARVDFYVCADCGYVEYYVKRDDSSRYLIREHGEPLG